jgi:hypothetical protein
MLRTPVRLRPFLASSLLLATAVAGCGVEKSENPLSPSVAGPIAGVEISTPRAIEPAPGARVKNAQQPIRLTVGNASSNGVRPLSYTFEVATDTTFQTKVFARSGVAPGEGQTSVVIDRLDQARTYAWRAKAEDGANTGSYVNATFEVLPQPQLGAPTLVSPINDATIASQQAQLVVGSSTRNAGVGTVSYEVQVALDVAFAQLVAAGVHPEAGAHTTFHPASLAASRRHFWRARASDGETTSAWAATQSFITAAAPAPPPPSPSPSPSPQPPGSCASNNGPAIVACVSARYADYRRPVGSLSERQHNMEFLRDRIIEAGRCGGLDLGYNMKRGGPERSIDFLAWRRGDGEMGIDLGSDYDNYGTTLQLQWMEAGLGATWAAYPPVSCQ